MMESLVIIRGAGDLASGVAHALWHVGYPILMLETDQPAAIRKKVCFCEAIYKGTMTVEEITAVKITHIDEMLPILQKGQIPILVDPEARSVELLHPAVVIDGILAKRNLGMNKNMAPITIGLGPGFEAGVDVDIVIETMRGEQLGTVIREGFAIPNTGVPGEIAGFGRERVIHAVASGVLRHEKEIGQLVKKEDVIGYIDHEGEKVAIVATLDGVLRGFIQEGYIVKHGMKIADIDPRIAYKDACHLISDKAKCIGESVVKILEK